MKKEYREALEKGLYWVGVFLVAYLVIYERSPLKPYVRDYLPLDINFLLTPILGMLLFFFISDMTTLIIKGELQKVVRRIFIGIGIAFFAYGSSSQIPFLRGIENTGLYVGISILGILIYFMGFYGTGIDRVNRFNLLIMSAGIGILGYGVWQFLNIMNENFQISSLKLMDDSLLVEFSSIAFAVFVGFEVAALGLIGEFLSKFYRVATEETIRPVIGTLSRNFLLGLSVIFYSGSLHPFLYRKYPFAPVLEWVLVLLIVFFWSRSIRYPENLYEFPEWKKHVQEVSKQADADYQDAVNIQKIFVNNGIKEPLIVYTTSILDRNGTPLSEVSQVLQPITSHRDKRIPYLALPWERRRISERNKRSREALLKDLMDYMDKRFGNRQKKEDAGNDKKDEN
jgi:hypothetical protein